jgi:ATP-dependent DNA helicase RecG
MKDLIKQNEGRRLEFKEKISEAPVFKKMGIIEQWGNGLRMISDEMKEYPEIDLKWSEPGMTFRVTFLKKNYVDMSGEMSGEMSEKIIALLNKDNRITIPEIAKIIGVTDRTIERKIQGLQKMNFIQRIGPNKGGHWEVIKK